MNSSPKPQNLSTPTPKVLDGPWPADSAAPTSSGENDASQPAERRGRPNTYAPEKAEAIAGVIRTTGATDTKAAMSVGVAKATLSRWKREIPALVRFLNLARIDLLKEA